jgi:hypothetical protein
MSQTVKKDKKILAFSIVTAATTVIAGIIHLQMAPGSISHNLGEGILFLVGGVLQVFWAVPVIKGWGRIWQVIGIVGTAVFFILWYSDRLHLIPETGIQGGPQGHAPPREFHENNMTGGSPRGPPRGIGVAIGGIMFPPIEFLQLAFIGLYAALIKMNSKKLKS